VSLQQRFADERCYARLSKHRERMAQCFNGADLERLGYGPRASMHGGAWTEEEREREYLGVRGHLLQFPRSWDWPSMCNGPLRESFLLEAGRERFVGRMQDRVERALQDAGGGDDKTQPRLPRGDEPCPTALR